MSQSSTAPPPVDDPRLRDAGGFGGHPPGLSTLFFTEMWERFSYYGMRAILILFMTAQVGGENGGLGLDESQAGAIYGIYTSLVYLLSLPGGWVADKLWGSRKAVFVGGCIIAAGHFSMAIPTMATFFIGLGLIIVGTGLLKPNVSAMVGDLYAMGDPRRDSGYSIYYMGINIGALLGPTLCGLAGENYNFHLGFSLAGVGMLLGLIQFRMGGGRLRQAGLLQTADSAATLAKRGRTFYSATGVALAAVALLALLTTSGVVPLTIERIAAGLGSGILIVAALFIAYLFFGAGLDAEEKKRFAVIVWLCLLAAVFWSGFEQAGSSMNLIARDLTDRIIFGWEMPTSWLQNVNPIFIVVFAPVFGWLWIALARRNANPSTPLKFALALLLLAAGFLVLVWGYANATPDATVSMAWLIVAYFFHTVAELCLSPVGLSSMTTLAPQGRTAQMMGLWFVAAAFGNLIAGIVAGGLEGLPPSELFQQVATTIGLCGLAALLLSPIVRRFTEPAKEPDPTV